MNKTIISSMITQMGREAMASWTYRMLAYWCRSNGYDGAEKYFSKSSDEELEHMDKWADFLNDYVDEIPSLPEVASLSNVAGNDLKSMVNSALELELSVTNDIVNISSVAAKVNAFEVLSFLDWFNNEQIDSVSQLRTILRMLERAGDNEAAIKVVDEYMGDL